MEIAAFWAAHSGRLTGEVPSFEEAGEFARYIGRAKDGELWIQFTTRIEYERGIAKRAADLRAPLFSETADEWSFWAAAEHQGTLIDAFRCPVEPTFNMAVWERAAVLLSRWMQMPQTHDPNSAEFVWARARMAFAPLGPALPSTILDALTSRYPMCPFTPDDGPEEIKKAHLMCGWPATVALVNWRSLSWEGGVQEWQRAAAMFHMLRHTRIDDDRVLTIGYDGQTTVFPPEESCNVFGQWGKQRRLFFSGLKIGTDKDSPTEHAAFASVIHRMSSTELVRRRPLIDLPSNVLAGSWSHPVGDPQGANGQRLQGVWIAEGGRVKEHYGDESDILDWHWNQVSHHEAPAQKELDAILRVLPKTYEMAFPSDIFFDTFPQLERLDGEAGLVMRSLFDAPIIASLIRRDIHELAYEFPIIAFLPTVPTLDLTTNQGKTAAAHTYARALSPSVISLGASDSGSAPDVRSVADVVRTYGTAYLDEFRMPRQKNHVLSRENLQSLCTGGSVTAGRVLENSGTLQLRHSLVLSTKGLDTTPDIINRTIPWFLGDLTEATRADPKKLNDILSGRVAMRMRLGALAMVEKYELADMGEVGGGSAFRFPYHRNLAMRLAVWRGCDPRLVDEVFSAMQQELQEHCKKADENGVLSALEDGRTLRLRWSAFWEDLDPAGLAAMYEYLATRGEEMPCGPNNDWASGSLPVLIEGRMRAADMPDKPFCELLTRISGQHTKCGNKNVTVTLMEEMRRELDQDEVATLPGMAGMRYEFRWTVLNSRVIVQMRKRVEIAA